MATHERIKIRLTKAEARLKRRQESYDEMVAKRPNMTSSYHRPGSLKKKGK